MEFKTTSALRVSDHLVNDRLSWPWAQGSGWKHRLKSAQTLFLHAAASLQRFSKLPNFLQKSIYPSVFHRGFHSFTFRLTDGRNMISFFKPLIGDLTSVKFVPEVFSSTCSNYSFNLYMNDRYTSTREYVITM